MDNKTTAQEMKDHSTQNRYDAAFQLGVANELIENVRQISDCLYFTVKGAEYSCRLTKMGHVKRNSVRKD